MRILDTYKAHKLAIGFSIAASLSLSPVYAQDLPDPATISVPDLSSAKDPKIAKQGWKYFVFHKAGVSFEEAYADFAECYTFLPTFSGGGELPKFIPWGQSEDPDTQELASNGGNFGVVGVAIGALIEGPLRRRAYQSRMRRCMEPRGYDRYGLDKDIWEQISGSYSLESIAIKAKIASGPKLADTPLEISR
ncbi:hypothetical protein ACR9YC_10885 [Parasphingorhabdus sp. DH2-15]|uniref:hypothetical protein n=1 Tax=Parasphingorhabdus sp. DH2-15 TaxID=3444112 RepID=UPI003F688E51